MSSSSTIISHLFQVSKGSELLEPLKDTDNWLESALRFNNSSVSFYKYDFVPDHAIPSLFGYIILC